MVATLADKSRVEARSVPLNFKLFSVAFAVNIPLGILLVTRLGAVGVIIATIVAELIRYAGARYVLVTNVEAVRLISTRMKH